MYCQGPQCLVETNPLHTHSVTGNHKIQNILLLIMVVIDAKIQTDWVCNDKSCCGEWFAHIVDAKLPLFWHNECSF